MRSEENGNSLICIQNLVSMIKTECPLARDKGIDARLIDMPASNFEELDEDVTNLLNDYEPRAQADSLDILHDENGNFRITVNTSTAGGAE